MIQKHKIDRSIRNPSVPWGFIERWNFDPADSFNLMEVVDVLHDDPKGLSIAPVVYHPEIDSWATPRCPLCGRGHVADGPYGAERCDYTAPWFYWKIPVTSIPNNREMSKYFPACASIPRLASLGGNLRGLYLIKAANRYKIGVSENVGKRIKSLATSSPFPIELVHVEATEDYQRLENYLHKRFAYFRVHLEWFEFPESMIPSVIDVIRGGAS